MANGRNCKAVSCALTSSDSNGSVARARWHEQRPFDLPTTTDDAGRVRVCHLFTTYQALRSPASVRRDARSSIIAIGRTTNIGCQRRPLLAHCAQAGLRGSPGATLGAMHRSTRDDFYQKTVVVLGARQAARWAVACVKGWSSCASAEMLQVNRHALRLQHTDACARNFGHRSDTRLRKDKGVSRHSPANPRHSWLPDLGSNQGPTD